MTVTQVETTSAVVECTSVSITGTTQVEIDLKRIEIERDLKATRTSLYNQIFDALKKKGYSGHKVNTLLRLLSRLGQDVTTGANKFLASDGVHQVSMNMRVHDLLETFMLDKEFAEPGSIHDQVNKLFLPEGKTFLHDVSTNCVLEVRDL